MSKCKALFHRSASSLTLLAAMGLAAPAQSTSHALQSDKGQLVGAWHLVRIVGSDGKTAVAPLPKGMLIYTNDGHMSVQLMYPDTSLSNEYVREGYEGSFGSYNLNEAAHTVTHHVQGAVTRDELVGKDLPRLYQLTSDGHLVIRSARQDEHWSVTWEKY